MPEPDCSLTIKSTHGSRVGVVIPTRGRARLVLRAVQSVLGQTHADLEVVVVLDGPDDETVATLAAVADPRLRVEVISRQGASAARNAGVRLLNADWVAFLDDDDLWRPRKLEVQLALARTASVPLPIVSCRFLNITKDGQIPSPLRLPQPNESVSEYLFVLKGWLARSGAAQTSTFFAPRSLLEQVPFDASLPRHQDWDWLLRAAQVPGVAFMVAPEILTEWDRCSAPQRLSGVHDWRYSFNWVCARRRLVTPRAYSGFLLTIIPASAARGGASKGEFLLLLKESMRGRPNFMQLAIFTIWWLVPKRLINWARRVAMGYRC